MTSKMPLSVSESLTTITAAGPNQIWAGGSSGGKAPAPQLHHWDGRSWSSAKIPTGLEGTITVIKASSPTDIWAFDVDGQAGTSTALHSNGNAWSVSKKWPASAHMSVVDAVDTGPDDVWVFNATGQVHHYNGHEWLAPVWIPGVAQIVSASAVSAGDIWVVGSGPANRGHKPVATHYDGQTWKPSTLNKSLTLASKVSIVGVQAQSDSDVWVEGEETDLSGPKLKSHTVPFFAHYNGKAWTSKVLPGAVTLACISPDGSRGVWVLTASGKLLHYVNGTLTPETISRLGGEKPAVNLLTTVPRSSVAWALGTLTSGGEHKHMTTAIFKYGQ